MTDNPEAMPRLSEEDVRERLKLCVDIGVIDEIYSLGQSIEKEIIDSIRALDSKAALFAAYGTAIVTLLVSGSQAWGSTGNQWSSWISVCAGIAALRCMVFSVKSLAPQKYRIISQKNWLEPECLHSELSIKRYHILAIWFTMESRFGVHEEKLEKLHRAFYWLRTSGLFLVYLLFQIAFVKSFRLASSSSTIANILGNQLWQGFCRYVNALSGLVCALILVITLILAYRSDRGNWWD